MKFMQPRPSLMKRLVVLVAVLLWAFAFRAIPSQASPPETLTREQVKQYCSVLKVLHSLKDDPFLRCIEKYGEKSFYTKPEVESLTISTQSSVTPAKDPGEGPIKLKERPPEGWAVVRDAFKHLKIRQDHTDVLYEEDPSQAAQGKKFDDLSGATFSFARDLKADTDTWAAQAAVILPMIWTGNLVPGWKPIAYGFVSQHLVTPGHHRWRSCGRGGFVDLSRGCIWSLASAERERRGSHGIEPPRSVFLCHRYEA